jgi:hypothetical protein
MTSGTVTGPVVTAPASQAKCDIASVEKYVSTSQIRVRNQKKKQQKQQKQQQLKLDKAMEEAYHS